MAMSIPQRRTTFPAGRLATSAQLPTGPSGRAGMAAGIGQAPSQMLALGGGLQLPANRAVAPSASRGAARAPGISNALSPQQPTGALAQPSLNGLGAAPAPADPRAGIEALYQQMLDANSKMGGQIQDIGQSNIAALQRRNASNAAMAGRSIGGGYLGGQRAMLTQGLDQMNKNLLSNDQARQGILAQQLQNRLADQRRDEDWARQDTIRGEEAKAKATQTQREGRGEALKKAFENAVGKLSGHPWVEQNIADYLATGNEAYLDEIQKAIDEAVHGPSSAPTAPGYDYSDREKTKKRLELDKLIEQADQAGNVALANLLRKEQEKYK